MFLFGAITEENTNSNLETLPEGSILQLNQSPLDQAEPSFIQDNVGHNWDYSTAFNLEDGLNLKISSYWPQKMHNATLNVSRWDTGSGIFEVYSMIDVDLNNSNWCNFTHSIDTSAHNIATNWLFTLNVYDNITLGWAKKVQPYTMLDDQTPILNTHSGPIEYGTILVSGDPKIRIAWSSNLFYDNVFVDHYEIARKKGDGDTLSQGSGFTAALYASTSNLELLDDPGDMDQYYYAIRGVDALGGLSQIKTIDDPLSLDMEAPEIEAKDINQDGKSVSDPIYPEGNLYIKITTATDCVEGTILLINKDGGIKDYEFDLRESATGSGIWTVTVKLISPRGTSATMAPGTYKIAVNLTDEMGNKGVYTIDNAFTILDVDAPPISDTDWVLYGIIGGVVALALVGFIVLKKRRESGYEYETEVEFNSGPAKKKKSKIYSGASSIGRASGMKAEILRERKKGQTERPLPSKYPLPSKRTKVSSVKSTAPPTQRQAQIPTTQGDIDALLDDSKPSAASTMRIKSAERAVDLTRKMDFLDSKLTSLDQNMAIMNVILDQTSGLSSNTRSCPSCNRNLSLIWSACPYCKLDENKATVSEKMTYVRQIGQKMMCPACNKMLEASWSKCPFCHVKDHNL